MRDIFLTKKLHFLSEKVAPDICEDSIGNDEYGLHILEAFKMLKIFFENFIRTFLAFEKTSRRNLFANLLYWKFVIALISAESDERLRVWLVAIALAPSPFPL